MVVSRKRKAAHGGIVHVSEIDTGAALRAFAIDSTVVTVISGTSITLKIAGIRSVSYGTDIVAGTCADHEKGSHIRTIQVLEYN